MLRSYKESIYFKNKKLCDIKLNKKDLIITNLEKKDLIFLILYISSVINRKDFIEKHYIVNGTIHYPLKSSDVIKLTYLGFKYNTYNLYCY